MLLSKKVFGIYFGFRATFTCVLILLSGLLVLADAGLAAGKPKTVAEIALYRGPDREKMLIEGAKKEGKFIFYTSNSWMTNVVSKEFAKKRNIIPLIKK